MPKMLNNKKKLGNFRRRRCESCDSQINYVDYKNIEFLNKYISSTGQIKPRATTGTCAKDQRKIATAIKRARFMALIPYTKERIRSVVPSTGRKPEDSKEMTDDTIEAKRLATKKVIARKEAAAEKKDEAVVEKKPTIAKKVTKKEK